MMFFVQHLYIRVLPLSCSRASEVLLIVSDVISK